MMCQMDSGFFTQIDQQFFILNLINSNRVRVGREMVEWAKNGAIINIEDLYLINLLFYLKLKHNFLLSYANI